MPYANFQEAYVCDGDSVVVAGNTYNSAGIYIDTVSASNLCDSVLYTSLDIYQSPSLFIESVPDPPEICLGDTVILEASDGFISYAWNNGGTSHFIFDNPTSDTWYVVEAVDSNGCIVREDIWVYVDSCITQSNEFSSINNLNVYPNPASDKVTFEFTGDANNIKLFNILGELVFTQYISEGQHSVQLAVGSFEPAIYSVQLHRKNGDVLLRKVFTIVR